MIPLQCTHIYTTGNDKEFIVDIVKGFVVFGTNSESDLKTVYFHSAAGSDSRAQRHL